MNKEKEKKEKRKKKIVFLFLTVRKIASIKDDSAIFKRLKLSRR